MTKPVNVDSLRTHFEDYCDKYQSVEMRREDGILQITLGTDGGPLQWGRLPHAELEEAFVWYEQQVPGLGSQFLLALDATINSLRRNPFQYPVVYKDVRRALMRRFPYQVFYVQNEMQIVIIAVFHGMRNPSIWQSRD